MNQKSGFFEVVFKRDWWILIFFLILAAVLRLYHLDFQSLWADELWGVEFCHRGWKAMIDNLVYKDSHPPGYQTFLCGWMALNEPTDFWIRFPSAVAGVLAVAALFQFSRRYFSLRVTILACGLLTVSYNGIFYSQEARAYIFVMLFSILFFNSYLKIFQMGEESRRECYRFLVFGFCLIYLHYVGVVLVIASFLLLPLIMTLNTQNLKRSFYAYLALFVMYIPWLPVVYRHMFFADPSFLTAVPNWQTIIDTARFLMGPDTFRFQVGLGLSVIFVVSLVLAALQKKFERPQKTIMIYMLFCLLPIAIFYVKSNAGPSSYTIRHFAYAIPFVCLMAAFSFEQLVRWLQSENVLSVFLLAAGVSIFLALKINMPANVPYGGELYTRITKVDYRDAVKVVANDRSFMESKPRYVFSSNLFFDHYLRYFRVRRNGSVRQWHHDLPERIREYDQFLREKQVDQFYYLEIYSDFSAKAPSQLYQRLDERYHRLCQSRLVWTHVTKFSRSLPSVERGEVPACDYPQ